MIGELRHQVTLQSVSRTSDGAGGFTEAWADVATVWAKVSPKSGLKRSFASKLEADVTHVIRMRYQPGVTVTPMMRITFGSRIFQIHAALNEDERNIWIDIAAVEGPAS